MKYIKVFSVPRGHKYKRWNKELETENQGGIGCVKRVLLEFGCFKNMLSGKVNYGLIFGWKIQSRQSDPKQGY